MQPKSLVLVTLAGATLLAACNPAAGTNNDHASLSARAVEKSFFNGAAHGFDVTSPNWFTDSALKVQVTNVHLSGGLKGTGGTLKTQAAGTGASDDPSGDLAAEVDVEGTAIVAADGGTPHQMIIHEEDFPPMSDHDSGLSLTDNSATDPGALTTAAADAPKTKPIKATFTADADYVRFTATSPGGTVTLAINPDGSYTVDGTNYATTAAAAKALLQHPVQKAVTLEHLAMLDAALATRSKAIATLNAVDCGNSGGQRPGPAIPDPKELVQALIALREKAH